MALTEKEAADSIKKQAREVVKLTRKFRFHELAPQVVKLKALIETASKLPGANPEIDPEKYEYPLVRQSEYLLGDKSAKVIAKIEEAVPAHACKCDPIKCQCTSTEETFCDTKGTLCEFCNEAIKVGDSLHTSEVTGSVMCAICARILVEQVRFKESVAYAVVNLIEDACAEADEPYFQFKTAQSLVEETQVRLESFRIKQREKTGQTARATLTARA